MVLSGGLLVEPRSSLGIRIAMRLVLVVLLLLVLLLLWLLVEATVLGSLAKARSSSETASSAEFRT